MRSNVSNSILRHYHQLPKVVQGVTFRNGVEVTNTPAQNAA